MRYADDFVVLCESEDKVKRGRTDLVQRQLHPTSASARARKRPSRRSFSPGKGFAFLGFTISSWSVSMRPKSVEKFKTKIRELTVRHQNLDQEVVAVRKSTRWFAARRITSATAFSTVRDLFRRFGPVDARMRIRCMKSQMQTTHGQLAAGGGRHFRNMGLIFLADVWAPTSGEDAFLTPSREALVMASPGALTGHAGK